MLLVHALHTARVGNAFADLIDGWLRAAVEPVLQAV